MSSQKSGKPAQNVFFLAGAALLVIGITLVLAWWPEVVIFFRGIAGMGLALAGLLVMYLVKK